MAGNSRGRPKALRYHSQFPRPPAWIRLRSGGLFH